MSRQVSIDTYFQGVKSSVPAGIKIMSGNTNVAKRRRNRKTKTSTPAKNPPKKEAEVICLSSDDENEPSPQKLRNVSQNSVGSNSSQTTIIYTLTPQTPVKTPRKTPRKTPHTASSDNCPSTEKKKFYSPTKKRNVVKRTAVKRNLARDTFIQPHIYSDDALYNKACEDMDDKSKFRL